MRLDVSGLSYKEIDSLLARMPQEPVVISKQGSSVIVQI